MAHGRHLDLGGKAGSGLRAGGLQCHVEARLATSFCGRIDAAELELDEIEAHLAAIDVPRFHGRQVFQWIYRRGVSDFGAMTDLGRALRED